MPKVTVYTDGGASGNPGPGGYGIVLLSGEHRKEINGVFFSTYTSAKISSSVSATILILKTSFFIIFLLILLTRACMPLHHLHCFLFYRQVWHF